MDDLTKCLIPSGLVVAGFFFLIVSSYIYQRRSWERFKAGLDLLEFENEGIYRGTYRGRKLFVTVTPGVRGDRVVTVEITLNCKTKWKFDLRPNAPVFMEGIPPVEDVGFPADNIFGRAMYVQYASPPTIIREIFADEALRQRMIKEAYTMKLMFLKESNLRYDIKYAMPDITLRVINLVSEIADVIEHKHQPADEQLGLNC